VVAAAVAHAGEARPNEACGLVAGRDGVGRRYLRARNAAVSPYRFELHPEDLVGLVHRIEADGDELVAIVHSHPSSDASPSLTDVREARWDLPQLIVGGPDGAVRAWRYGPDGPLELPLAILDGPQQGSSAATTRRSAASSTMSISHEPSSSPER
jgi:proteasome lid subunit RPN8/RPN11